VRLNCESFRPIMHVIIKTDEFIACFINFGGKIRFEIEIMRLRSQGLFYFIKWWTESRLSYG